VNQYREELVIWDRNKSKGNRLGIIFGCGNLCNGGNDYGDRLAEDDKLRKYIHARLAKASVSRIIERTLKPVTITPRPRPGTLL
jgi:small subunit ribosomal protein S3